MFLQIGLIVALALSLAAFELSMPYGVKTDLGTPTSSIFDDDIIPQTYHKEIKKPLPIPTSPVTAFITVTNNTTTTSDPNIFSTEVRPTDSIVITKPHFEPEDREPERFFIVEDMPIFRPERNKTKAEGDADLLSYIAANIIYPDEAIRNNVSGRVFIEFVVGVKGKVISARVARSSDKSLDDEALRVIRSLPDFSPGIQAGRPVEVVFNVPVNFILK